MDIARPSGGNSLAFGCYAFVAIAVEVGTQTGVGSLAVGISRLALRTRG